MQKKVIKKLSDLYLVQRGKYLSQSKKGKWRHVVAGQVNQYTKKKDIRLSDWHLENHLNGNFTIGTFAGDFGSIFMSFDIDFHDNQMAKWITYKIAYTLNSFGIDHHINYSGSKGYHIDIFFEDKITVEHARKFFDYVIEKSDVKQHTQGQVEFRVSEKQGIKLPLGIHQVTKSYCGFCLVETGLNVMNKKLSEEYLLTINQIPSRQVLDVIEIAESELEHINTKQFIESQDAISSFVPLANHEQSEDYSISRAQKLLTEGLQIQGSRHNSTLLICMYLKYCG
ncbi:TOTE conflict system archaeo-eukaryotic primase domain-containing protein [Paenibacillus sp. FSL K6-2524]|uniref:TOTE conflict system archaeo-eukaryotic primase domain-containing protein n=1 Tax=Paenibacillus sp. FSL K6-2524 TaxID=2954516 RepID=UPI0030FADC8A